LFACISKQDSWTKDNVIQVSLNKTESNF
jgi:hypothetical protein